MQKINMGPSVPFFSSKGADGPRAAIFLSGSGTNAERILESWRAAARPPFSPVVLVTDAPRTSRACELGTTFGLPVVENDIRQYYRDRGESRFSLATAEGRKIRREWTDSLRRQLAEFDIDFGILAGFMPLTNITGDFPCLNVHPGDLTYEKDGRRWLVGLHTLPVERAILEGLESMRSSVIVAQPYEAAGDNMDSGPILGLSGPVPIDWQGCTLEALRECARQRPANKPKGGFNDRLQWLAEHNLERLKVKGDWKVFPRVVFDFAAGRFARGPEEELFFAVGGRMQPVRTVVYSEGGREIVFRQ